MFLLFINDLSDYAKSCNVGRQAIVFADDCHRASDMQSLRDDMDNLLQWEQDWQMEFHPSNLSKCQLLRITNKRKPFARDYDIHGHKLEELESAIYLGVTIQKNLSWNIHIDQITKKVNSTRAFIQRNLNHCPRETKSTCYLTLVRPLLEYACMVWGPHTAQNTQKLEAVQRRSARFVMNNYQQTSSETSMLQTLQWPTLAERRARIKAAMMYNVQDSEWPSSYTTNRATHIYNNSKWPYSKIHSPVCQNATI
jgi:hypothetical protein